LPATAADPKTPTDLLEARNAVAMARAAGAEKYAPDVLRKAEDFLARGEDYYHRKQGDKAIGTVARGAVQSAEDARVLTFRRRHDEELAAQQESERQKVLLAQQNEADAKARAEEEALNRQKAEEDRREAERARADAEAARAAAVAAQQAATAQAAQTVAAAERDKEETRQRLLGQLNQVLQTRESARGLIVDMPDVLFDTGQYTLKPGARERLAKVAGILLAYPGLRVQVEGHTDSVGGDEYNQTLSENRAAAVRDYLTSQGVSRDSISSQGFGKTQPVASNDTASGRQQNRRVDLVVSGEAIGTTASMNAPVQ
jgi:outer membrane protein OmpA-like peptidoglycan-associated protein